MLRPSYSELMNLLNESNDVDSEITSRYTIVIAAAKRARQLIDGQRPLTKADTDKAVSIAVAEMAQGKLKIAKSGGSSESNDEKAQDSRKVLIEAENLDDM